MGSVGTTPRRWVVKLFAFITGAFITAVLVLIGYAIWFEANDPGHGQITKKHYSPAYYYYTSQCAGYDSKGGCTTTIQVPHYAPECYEIDYTDGKHDGDACVAPEEYERYEVGGYYPAGAQ